MSICIHIPFYNPQPSKKEGYRNLTRLEYLQENIKNLKNLSVKTYIYVHTHNDYLDGQNKDFEIVKHKLKKKDLEKGYLTWIIRKFMEKHKNLYDYYMYIEHDIKFTEQNFRYWKKYTSILNKEKFNVGFLVYEKNNKMNEKYSIHITKKLYNILILNNQNYLVNNLENYSCFWIYDKKNFNEFTKTDFWNFKKKISNYRHYYGITEQSAIGWNGLDMERYKATLIPLNDELKIDQDCLIEHLTNNYINKFSNLKKNYSDIRGVCKFNINEVIDIKEKLKFYQRIPFYFDFLKKLNWKLRIFKKIYDKKYFRTKQKN